MKYIGLYLTKSIRSVITEILKKVNILRYHHSVIVTKACILAIGHVLFQKVN